MHVTEVATVHKDPGYKFTTMPSETKSTKACHQLETAIGAQHSARELKNQDVHFLHIVTCRLAFFSLFFSRLTHLYAA